MTTTSLASELIVTSQPPSGPVAGATFSTTVAVSDGSHVVSDYSGSVSIALTSSAGATLSGTKTQTVVNGVASFTDLSVDKTGSYTLTATRVSLTSATSSSFTVQPGAAAQLAFTQLPTNPTVATAMSPAIQVTVKDSLGNTVSSTESITISLASNPAGGTPSGTLTRAAVGGVASFDDLTLDKAGSYTFGATDGTFTASLSSSVTVS